jgi:hypothetical protein
MTVKTCWESFKAEGNHVLDRLADLLREGNVRRVVVAQHGKTVAEFPLTAGVVGAVIAPTLAAVGAVVALLKDCTIHIERAEETAGDTPAAPAPEPPFQAM